MVVVGGGVVGGGGVGVGVAVGVVCWANFFDQRNVLLACVPQQLQLPLVIIGAYPTGFYTHIHRLTCASLRLFCCRSRRQTCPGGCVFPTTFWVWDFRIDTRRFHS